MSSPNIKFQTLIRKYKNGLKEGLDKQRIIEHYTFQIVSDDVLTTNAISTTKQHYSIDDIKIATFYSGESLAQPIAMKLLPAEHSDSTLFSFSPMVSGTAMDHNIKDYMGDGLLKKVYNAELCDYDWLIMMYFMNRLYPNFATHDKIAMKSLHINALPGATLSAMHHFLYSSKINNKYKNVEWNWMGTINTEISDPYNLYDDLHAHYKSNLLELFNSSVCSPNNIKFIVNESTQRGKINFLCVDACNDLRHYIGYAVLIIKLLESNCIMYMKVPQIGDWTVETYNAIVLYSLIFQEIYLFKFDLGSEHNVLICKNKKKLTNELLYKKLLSLLMDDAIKTSTGIFTLDFLVNCDVTKKILDIFEKNDDAKPIVFNDIIYEINKVLDLNLTGFI